MVIRQATLLSIGIILTLAAACTSSNAKTEQPAEVTASSSTSQANDGHERHVRASQCTEVAGSDELLQSGAVVLLGGNPGAREDDNVSVALACAALSEGERVTVGLDIDGGETERVDEFLTSEGDDDALQALLAGPFWQDGDSRATRSLVDALDGLRLLSKSSANLEISLLDSGNADDRNKRLSDRVIAATESEPDRIVIAAVTDVNATTNAGNEL